ncbi:pyridoxamine 5'-phosphate oxidase family protein [[Limnothrix rosea] IAM M-220]|uniref:pyridoxamine 5'-phosphate oxidase family protein n=1 Tax=[Limnothrix rosea] IAM M-220 TaxID=454133 RepID=UPI0009592BD8|nr:pyridoxamine 5'-phosphate oxidase family protein [[Limnothrix rosea] IAM M-220]OKH11408.1 pyridoxamine 5'-phosphate oxidase [[Limnothrix rosea] IAM M-220]
MTQLVGWTQEISPFHDGEMAVQELAGVRTKAEKIGRRFIRDFMPAEHQEFYGQLPFIFVGSLDEKSRLWASILTSKQAFIFSPDDKTLNFQATPLLGDRLADNLKLDANLGFLGIELHTRRRNRVNGKVTAIAPDNFTVNVTQSFGNCPQFIHKRNLVWLPERFENSASQAQTFDHFTEEITEIIRQADSFYLATSFNDKYEQGNEGVDMSHRGGKPGFVKIEGDRSFIFPNFAGNNFYNSLGNLHLNNRIGVLFIDFKTGNLVSLTGTAEILWEGEQLENFKGAEQLIRVTAEEIIFLPKILPFR